MSATNFFSDAARLSGGFSGLGDLYSASATKAEIDKANNQYAGVKAYYGGNKAKLVPVQIKDIDGRLNTARLAIRRAENAYTAESEKPFYVDSDYDNAYGNARSAQGLLTRLQSDITAYVLYNADETARLKALEHQRQLALTSRVSEAERKAAEMGLPEYLGFKAKQSGQTVSKAAKELAEAAGDVVGGILAAPFRMIPWWAWVIGAAGVGAYLVGPTLIAQSARGKVRARLAR